MTAKKKHIRRRLSDSNRLKLEILFLCKDKWVTTLEVADKIPDYPRKNIQSRMSELNLKYKGKDGQPRPYLRCKRRKGKLNQYRLTIKGKRILGKLLKLFRNGEELRIVWKTRDQGKSILEQMKRDPVKPRIEYGVG